MARSTEFGANREIVRMDTAHGQVPHLDRLYLPPGTDEERKGTLEVDFTYERMKHYLLAHWTDFVDAYAYYNE